MALSQVSHFRLGSGNHKYAAHLKNGKIVQFGHKDYQHYKDTVPKNMGGGLWTHKDHLDPERRRRYRLRHGGIITKGGSKACQVKYSVCWFSYHYLW